MTCIITINPQEGYVPCQNKCGNRLRQSCFKRDRMCLNCKSFTVAERNREMTNVEDKTITTAIENNIAVDNCVSNCPLPTNDRTIGHQSLAHSYSSLDDSSKLKDCTVAAQSMERNIANVCDRPSPPLIPVFSDFDLPPERDNPSAVTTVQMSMSSCQGPPMQVTERDVNHHVITVPVTGSSRSEASSRYPASIDLTYEKVNEAYANQSPGVPISAPSDFLRQDTSSSLFQKGIRSGQ